MSNSTFSERLKIIIKEFNLDNVSLAKAGDISPQTITGYLKDGRVPNQRILELWVREFNLSGTWLLTGDGSMFHKTDVSDPAILRMQEAERIIKEHGEIGLEIVRLSLGTSKYSPKKESNCAEEKIAAG
ncbi:MAG: hypothetical protein BA863_07475 [Desulfovibrio sp. S3730MH75]|nr:MAG: hypothetical protein BA863_07475 [Desulfovibrio sp. S3730MH75]